MSDEFPDKETRQQIQDIIRFHTVNPVNAMYPPTTMGMRICKITVDQQLHFFGRNDQQDATINKSPPPEQKLMSTGTALSHIFQTLSSLSPLFLQRSADAYSEAI